MAWAPDYPDGVTEEVWVEGLRHFEENWGRGQGGLPLYVLAPDRAEDPAFRRAHARWERLSASPGAAVALQQMIHEMDVRLLLAIRVPTLVFYRTATPSPRVSAISASTSPARTRRDRGH